MFLLPTVDPETRLVTIEDLEIRDRNLPREPLTFHHLQRKRLVDSLLTPILSPRARTLVSSPRRWKHRLDLQRVELDEEVDVMMCLPNLLPVIFLSLRPVLDVPLTRKCKIRIMDV
jgi:hypothetical protein